MRGYLIMALLVALSPVDMINNGRLTETACYLLIGLVVVAAVKLARIEYGVRKGTINPYTLPVWLQDPTDGPEAGIRR